jgi:hypothetical protein
MVRRLPDESSSPSHTPIKSISAVSALDIGRDLGMPRVVRSNRAPSCRFYGAFSANFFSDIPRARRLTRQLPDYIVSSASRLY